MRSKSFVHSLRCAAAGLIWGFRTQRNIRIQFVIGLAVVPAAYMLKLPTTQILVLLLAIALVLAAELFNTAVEATIDLVSPGVHPLAKVAKDAAAGGVLVAASGAAAVGIFLFAPPLWSILFPDGG